MDIDLLVKLTTRAWALPILAQLGVGVAGRQAPLLAATGAPRSAFAGSLAHLIDLGLLIRNPGHGHPLRPEFKLTPAGAAAAKTAARIQRTLPPQTDLPLLRRSWTIPVLARTRAPRRFSDIKKDLPHVTDRALSLTLTKLESHNWLQRDIDPESRPPRPHYTAINLGRDVSLAVADQLS